MVPVVAKTSWLGLHNIEGKLAKTRACRSTPIYSDRNPLKVPQSASKSLLMPVSACKCISLASAHLFRPFPFHSEFRPSYFFSLSALLFRPSVPFRIPTHFFFSKCPAIPSFCSVPNSDPVFFRPFLQEQVSPRKVRRIVTNGVRSLQKCTLDRRSVVGFT